MKYLMFVVFLGGCTLNLQIESTATSQSGEGEIAEVISAKETTETDADINPLP